ncbi:hypothetical protein SAMN04488564_11724 [Lentzea waywayandensis]|uniref:Uncharacterized protein n=1 Tax=Lentzea waywayandensis TaxID=84724 RepID=A0A1I6FGN0_9PSEU|nr:hypothetical protein [Lentzea waywayandensis]SFR29100.1 hypothetical protein SAMN04488564_11724 [Lentzea waywayandensis]
MVVIVLTTTKFTLSPEQWVTRLARRHNKQLPELELPDAYYEGEQSLSYMHPELLRRLDSRLRSVVINWPPTHCGLVGRTLGRHQLPAGR